MLDRILASVRPSKELRPRFALWVGPNIASLRFPHLLLQHTTGVEQECDGRDDGGGGESCRGEPSKVARLRPAVEQRRRAARPCLSLALALNGRPVPFPCSCVVVHKEP